MKDGITIVLFFLVFIRLSKCFYEEKVDRAMFIIISTILYSVSSFTLLGSVILPMTFCVILDYFKKERLYPMQFVMAVLLLIAGYYTEELGAFYVAIMLFLAVLVTLVRRGYAYVTASGRFKKRI